MINKNNIIVFILVILLSSFSASAMAENYDGDKTTKKEQAVFAFFRALQTVPDYEFWISSNPGYELLSSDKQQKYLLKETLRLGRGYGVFNQNKDVLELKINILVKYVSSANGKSPRIKFTFFDTSEAYTPTFNYPYGKDIISLIINNLAVFSDLPLNETQNNMILKKIPYKDENFNAKLIVHVRASKSNYKRPIKIEPTKQWLMIGKIAYLRCDIDSYEKTGDSKLWDYVAPWYSEIYRIKNMAEEEKYPHPFDLFKD